MESERGLKKSIKKPPHNAATTGEMFFRELPHKSLMKSGVNQAYTNTLASLAHRAHDPTLVRHLTENR